MDTIEPIEPIAKLFAVEGEFLDAEAYGSGHIHATYVSRFGDSAGRVRRYVHQRINHHVFTRPREVMRNIARVCGHLRGKILAEGGDPLREAMTIVPAADGDLLVQTPGGDYWRTYVFIESARTYDVVASPDHLRSAAAAFARFQKRLADLPPPRLHETIPQFTDSMHRLRQFRSALSADAAGRAEGARREIDFVLARADRFGVLNDLLASGAVPERIAHNDTKYNNVLIDDATGKALAVIDLDTVMPGTVLYDFGDAVRLGASTAAEDERDLSRVHLNLDYFAALADGYLSVARDFLAPAEREHLAFAAWLITLTMGVRFLTDHLAGDVYYKVHRPNHNLDRCRTQFQMVAEMEREGGRMESTLAAV